MYSLIHGVVQCLCNVRLMIIELKISAGKLHEPRLVAIHIMANFIGLSFDHCINVIIVIAAWMHNTAYISKLSLCFVSTK